MQVDLLKFRGTAICYPLHQHSPLVHCMTNDVVQTFTANTWPGDRCIASDGYRNRRGQSVCGYRQCLVD